MEQTQEQTPAASQEQPVADSATTATPVAESTQANPFKAQIEAAKKEWESVGKPKEAEQPPPPHKEDKAATQEDGGTKKVLSVKDAAIRKAKGELMKIQQKMQDLDKSYQEALGKKDEMTAKIITGKYEILKEQEAEIQREAEINNERNGFIAEAEKEGTLKSIEDFLDYADFYIPKLSVNPDIGQIIQTTKYPYATMDLLFSTMAERGIKPETLLEQTLPTLKNWLTAVGRDAEAIVEKKSAPAPASPTPPKTVPASVVATTSGDQGSEPALKTDGASMEDVIRHMRKYGGKGIL